VIERFAEGVGRVLAPKGRILLLISSLTGLAEVIDLFSGYGFFSEIVMQQEIEDEMLYVLKIVRAV
jgi:release factor glutamine methyltransferase